MSQMEKAVFFEVTRQHLGDLNYSPNTETDWDRKLSMLLQDFGRTDPKYYVKALQSIRQTHSNWPTARDIRQAIKAQIPRPVAEAVPEYRHVQSPFEVKLEALFWDGLGTNMPGSSVSFVNSPMSATHQKH
jgi:hypothetical protein